MVNCLGKKSLAPLNNNLRSSSLLLQLQKKPSTWSTYLFHIKSHQILDISISNRMLLFINYMHTTSIGVGWSKNLSALYSHSYRHHPHIVKKQKKLFSASSQTKNEASRTIPSRLRLDTGSDLDLMTGTGMNCAEVTKGGNCGSLKSTQRT